MDCGRKILHCHNGREYRLPELPHYNVDVFGPETRNMYEYFGSYYHVHTRQPYHDVSKISGDTLAERYERTMVGIEHFE